MEKYTNNELNKKNVKELNKICKEFGIKKYSKSKKNEKIKKILNHNKIKTEGKTMNLKEEYDNIMDIMLKNPKEGTLKFYFKEFLKKIEPNEWWKQPDAILYCNKRVSDDGGVEWNTKSHGGIGKGKKNSDGNPSIFGDPGRDLQKIRTEDYETCWDNKNGNIDGPFRLNIKNFNEYNGSTKSHSFSKEIKNQIKKRSKGCCELCGYKGKIEIDHFIPKKKGGKSMLDNACALCNRCNTRKCAKEPEDFMKEKLDKLINFFKTMGMEKELKQYVNNTLSNSIC